MGPIRLRQPVLAYGVGSGNGLDARATGAQDASLLSPQQQQPGQRLAPLPYKPSEFELFVQRRAGMSEMGEGADALTVRRLGAELMTRTEDPNSADYSPQVPPDYLIKSGDEIVVTLWGSVDADVRVVVDRTGRINIPRVGPVLVSGVRYAELPEVIRRRVAQVFRNFDLSVSLGQLRGVRVYVTGFVDRPGTYSVSSLSSVLNALLRAGGPSAAGSLRNITLQRGRQTVARFDLYDFLLKGDRSADALVQPDDVIHVGPLGAQVGVIGSVNRPVILEIKPGETVDDALRMAGGFTAVADRSRVAVERLEQRLGERLAELPLPVSGRLPLSNGDVLRVFSAVDAQLSVQKQNKRVRVEGEVARPGEYVLPASSSINDALRAAGGLSPSAYVFGTQFTRESVQRTQQQNYERALRDLETELSRNNATQRTNTADESAAQTARAAATSQLIERLRAVKPNGRIVLQMTPESASLPELALEDGDRLYIPPRGSTVGVFGSVFNAGNYLWGGPRSIDDYLRLAGGPTRGADRDSVFVIRANGSVVSALQDGSSWFGRGGSLKVPAQPGDTIFVPEEMNKTTLVQSFRDWTQILYQLGLGAAAIKVLRD
ncbi:SLBB domain-containing protein [Azohydromonas caseinilytica]|uniref:Sugar ABC transporter substrate-binding protein n=1 Tax=Azohydromonas caseinilytica TaxID=2728836 RepID=A0A848FA37_9BURK|nr:SLBB domain-containing protein [Azohydromonas caseinilytica]NML15070.1 sugar ABC transporter substrate-binding protein [Azohydromonas caseinilytica]